MARITLVAGGAVSSNDFVYIDPVGLAHKASALTQSQATTIGVALTSATAGSSFTIETDALIPTFSGLTPGDMQYLTATSGVVADFSSALSSVVTAGLPGGYLTPVGRAITSSGIEVERGFPTFISASGL